ncbi:ATP-binding protein [Pleurocapsa sp. FMAR1]|uniref:ATP-binding protein n=1 Tax=Pleurocapsa sp. FMAR1 TaxID=3040204 RepID=UPI0029C92D7C|nr:ATP-binding protein [Pleurocapsa sp. FMAR1]
MNNDNIKDELILVVKELKKDLATLLNALQSAKYSIMVVQNQEDALTLAKSIKPSLIVLDISMSQMNGWEICRQLKNNSQTSKVPLVLINSSINTAQRVTELGWQNLNCVARNSQPQKIVHLIETFLSNRVKHSADFLSKTIRLKENHHLSGLERNLEEFTSLVSQDLQTSLSSLTMFTDLLTKEYQSGLDQTAQNYLASISNSSSRMQTLIEDLRNYAQAGKSEQTWLMVDLNQVMQQVIKDLQKAIADTKAEIMVGDLPCILINPQEIYQILQNLLENALKFSGNDPRIQITAVQQEQAWLIAVADNGIGIPQEFHSQVFQVFHRVHSTEAYSGAGIGLAVCEKIIDRYGGKIWVESNGDRGSTFYFTLPMDVCLQKTVTLTQVNN